MARVPLKLAVDDPEIVAGLALVREQQHVPGDHPPEAVAEAEKAATEVLAGLDGGGSGAAARRDARDVELVTLDPPGSRDLDQALHIERQGTGWRVRYAIADVAAFVGPGGALDASVWDRGLTFYMPDGRAPLHPDAMGEGSASLLPDQDRLAVLWTVDLDAEGAVVDGAGTVERAIVRSRAQLTYDDVQSEVDSGKADPDGPLALLREVGEARQRQEAARGGVSLDLPAQRVEAVDGGYRIEFETTLPSMGWNAQISLLVGMCAARRMVSAGVGLLRTMPAAPQHVLDKVRRTARALHVDWPDGASYAEVVRNLDSDDPDQAALLSLAARGLRGAGYQALPPEAEPEGQGEGQGERDKPVLLEHSAVAAPYAHVTAPLRRLGDRYATEVCLALEADDRPPDWVSERLADLPSALQKAGGRESGANRAAIDLIEALVLRPLIGTDLEVSVVSADDEGSVVVCRDPAIETRIQGHQLPLGDGITVRVSAADPTTRKLVLEPL